MRVITARRTNYLTMFQAEEQDMRALVRWMHVCVNGCEKARQSTASALWQDWMDETFIGLSGTDKILLHSGHRAANSRRFVPADGPAGGVRAVWRCLKKLLTRSESGGDLESTLAAYKRFFPTFRIPEGERRLAEVLPSQYLHACETFALLEKEFADLSPQSVFEIGAGAGAHMALLAKRSGGKLKDVVICDLPHSILAGYLFLRTSLPEYSVRLPDQFDESRETEAGMIQFVTSEQLPRLKSARFDFALNTQSFQEMELGVVNGYLREVARVLRPGGLLASKNSRISRHIEGNSLDRYDFSGFSQKIMEISTPFTNQLNPFDCVLTCVRT